MILVIISYELEFKLRYLIEQINFKKSLKIKYLKNKEDSLSSIEELEKKLTTYQKSIFEKIIEIISLGFIRYTEKYSNLTNENKKHTLEFNKNLKDAEDRLILIDIEIERLESEFTNKITEFKNYLVAFQNKLQQLSDNRYVNDYTRVKLVTALKKIITDREEFLQHTDINDSIGDIIEFNQDSKKWIDNKNKIFVENEKKKMKSFFDTVESKPLTDKQQEAVLVNENNNLILAGAGSGKTSVIVAKVSYLISKNILHPSEILVLAFNKNAQEELEDRFKKKGIHVKVKTFHSFGLSVIAQSTSQKFNLCPMVESPNNMTKFIRISIQNLIASSKIFLEFFLNFMAYFSVPYRSESEFNSLGEYYEYQKNYDMKTLKHEVIEKGNRQGENLTTLKEETVKSYQELVIANFLTLNGIKYLYEEPYEYKTYTIEKRQYKPDFYLPDYGVYIEHFGIDRDNKTAPYINNKEYLDGINWKVALHKEKNTILVQSFSYEFTENNILPLLKEKLLKHDVIFRELKLSEVSELLKEPIENNKFTKLFTTFLNHYKSNIHSLEDLKNKSKGSERTFLFVKIFEFIFNEYEKYLKRNNYIDFDDMIVQALSNTESGKYTHSFKHIFIDEFQDISTTRALLIQKILPINNTSITAVGDDWQSINRFAGSNIKIIQDFEKTFGISKAVALDYTFRFDNVISNIASDFVQKNPHQIKKEIKTVKIQDSNKFSILIYWTTGNPEIDLMKILNLIVKKDKDNKKKVMILGRYKFLFTDELIKTKNEYQSLDISFSTVHGSKGNEADYVIILNIDSGKFGFPSKIEDDPILKLVIPEGDEFEDAEERRLFYVALTRTKGTLFLLGDMYNKSTFMNEIIKNHKDDIYFLNDPKIKLSNCPECKSGTLKKRTGKNNNSFYGCSNFPRCEYTENLHTCPICKEETIKDMEKRIAKCSNDSCNFESALCIDTNCNGYMIERKGQYGYFLGCSNYPKCTNTLKVKNNS